MITKSRCLYIISIDSLGDFIELSDEDIEFTKFYRSEISKLSPSKGDTFEHTNDKIINKYTQLRRDEILNKLLK